MLKLYQLKSDQWSFPPGFADDATKMQNYRSMGWIESNSYEYRYGLELNKR